ncbi:cytochrome-c oxidase, cbb3-type subunit III [Saccharospirillum mangrovi]|uniref:cytochrome-c oxidase, cbb3-type subunit III n=1 Tax=Saccharospirillum mangrovi TaxID=2161747 RepID=UPI000D3A232A|nr:cytochrome-c oxidase, cbb3-type subunit III [Saccharospirillum mangrovi]
MSSFWSFYIIGITTIFLVGIVALIHFTRRMPDSEGVGETTGHQFDGIEEFNNPMPKWWLNLFWATIIFAVGYLIAMPVGNWKGLLNWSSSGQLTNDQIEHERRYGEIYQRLASVPVEDLKDNPQAMRVGQRLFEDNCALCHGQAATGGYGFPNLTDNDWLYGGAGDTIKTTVLGGRNGQMPAWGDALGAAGVRAVAEYVMQLSGQDDVNASLARQGQTLFNASCVACHGQDGTGNHALGAPNLTDNTWLYRIPGESLRDSVQYTVEHGRSGRMPAWADVLGEERVHIVAGYIYSLSQL